LTPAQKKKKKNSAAACGCSARLAWPPGPESVGKPPNQAIPGGDSGGQGNPMKAGSLNPGQEGVSGPFPDHLNSGSPTGRPPPGAMKRVRAGRSPEFGFLPGTGETLSTAPPRTRLEGRPLAHRPAQKDHRMGGQECADQHKDRATTPTGMPARPTVAVIWNYRAGVFCRAALHFGSQMDFPGAGPVPSHLQLITAQAE